jgi:D-alanyl-D-alanine carboxypeptidase/D-alanyl-D-alanine-endopeptidase (penicillin-binding protein 4)
MGAETRRHGRVGALAVLVVGALLLAGPAGGNDRQGSSLPPAIRAVMAKPNYQNASWGLLELNPATGRVVHSVRADDMFIPGSTAKLFTVSAVWKQLGADSRITTPVYALGARSGPSLQGELVLVGAGDLTLGGRTKPDGTVDFTDIDHADADIAPGATLTPEDPLAGIDELARQVRAAGITAVHGDVVVDGRLFASPFDPNPTPLLINDNLVDVLSTPTSPGQPAAVTVRPASSSYTVESSVTTVPAGQPTQITVSGQAPGVVTVTGTIAADAAPLLRVVPITDADAFGRTVFIEALQRAGVSVDAAAGSDNPVGLLPPTMEYAPADRVAAFVSPPYREYAKLILKVSLNIGANLGVCLLAVAAGSNDCDDGFAVMRTFLQSAQVDTSQIAQADGRGGDPADRATPVAVTQLLTYWTTQPDFDAFRRTLPILGVDGTLAGVAADTPAKGKVFAKTGTAGAGDPFNQEILVQAKALSGYISKPGGGFLVFDLVVNNAGGGPDIQIVFDVGNDIGQIAALLWREANPRP